MTREQFFNKLVENDGGNSPPAENQQIDVEKIVDTISLRLENKLNTELEKIYKQNQERNEVNNNDRDITEVKGINKEGRVQGNKDTKPDTN